MPLNETVGLLNWGFLDLGGGGGGWSSRSYSTSSPVYTVLGDRIPSGHFLDLHCHISLRCPAVQLCSDFGTAYITSTRRSKGHTHSYCDGLL